MSDQHFQTADAVYQADAFALANRRRQQEKRPVAADTPLSEPPGTAAMELGQGPSPARDARPRSADVLDSNKDPEQITEGEKRVGLALSGGGIRSATFSLGVLQRLAMHDTLREFDILSTVSGGGYIGAFLSAWIHHSSPDHVWSELKRCPENNQTEPTEVQWLRRYSNYLTPRVGALSLDALTVAATYLRNVALNMSVLIAFVTAMVMVPLLFLPAVYALLKNPSAACSGMAAFGSIALVASFIQLSPVAREYLPRVTRPVIVYTTVIAPGFLAALFGGAFLASAGQGRKWGWACLLFIAAILGFMATMQILFRKSGTTAPRRPVSPFRYRDYAPATAAAVIAGFLMLGWLHHTWKPVGDIPFGSAGLMLTFGAPLLVGVLAASVTLWIGLMGRDYPEMYREWWSRVGGRVNSYRSSLVRMVCTRHVRADLSACLDIALF